MPCLGGENRDYESRDHLTWTFPAQAEGSADSSAAAPPVRMGTKRSWLPRRRLKVEADADRALCLELSFSLRAGSILPL